MGELRDRPINPVIRGHARVPDDTRLWAALQNVAGGSWGGCVYDVDRIIEVLRGGTEGAGSWIRIARARC